MEKLQVATFFNSNLLLELGTIFIISLINVQTTEQLKFCAMWISSFLILEILISKAPCVVCWVWNNYKTAYPTYLDRGDWCSGKSIRFIALKVQCSIHAPLVWGWHPFAQSEMNGYLGWDVKGKKGPGKERETLHHDAVIHLDTFFAKFFPRFKSCVGLRFVFYKYKVSGKMTGDEESSTAFYSAVP